jgi:hypothetical protein
MISDTDIIFEGLRSNKHRTLDDIRFAIKDSYIKGLNDSLKIIKSSVKNNSILRNLLIQINSLILIHKNIAVIEYYKEVKAKK